MISGTAVASALASCLEESLSMGLHIALKEKKRKKLLKPMFWGRKGHLMRGAGKPTAWCYAGFERQVSRWILEE